MNIYVGNLSHDVTEDDLHQAFESFGQVESVNIIKDRFSGESRGFGFVEMPSRDEAQAAIKEAEGMELKGRVIRVSEAHSRSRGGGGNQRPDGDRRGGLGRGQERGRRY